MGVSTYCITHSLSDLPPEDRPRPCMTRDEHYPTCSGYTIEGRRCKGCLPMTAEYGHLCDTCFTRYVDALGRVGTLTHHLRSIEKSGQAVGERVSTSREPKLPIYDSWLAADGLMAAMGWGPIPAAANIDEAGRYAHAVAQQAKQFAEEDVHHREDAINAVILVRRFHQALARWPDSETESRHVPGVRCLECTQAELYRIAPRWKGDDMKVLCRGCGWESDWFTWWETTRPYIEAYKALKAA